MKFTLNWIITTYEATATGGCKVPTILTSSTKNATRPGNLPRMGRKFVSTWFYDQHSGFITNYIINHLPAANHCPILTVTM